MKKILAFAIAALALAACAREVAPVKVDKSREVRFTTNVQTFVLKSSALDGEQVRIFSDATLDNVNVLADAADGKLTPASKIYWKEGQTEKTTFAAVYPKENGSATIDAYNLAEGGNYDYAWHSKVLVATAKNVTPGEDVALDFKHPFAMITINVTNSLEGTPAITAVSLQDVYTIGKIAMLAGTSEGTTKGTLAPVAKEGAAGAYQAVVFPGAVRPVIKVTAGEKTYSFVLAADVTLEANKSYTAAIELKAGSAPAPQGEEAKFNFSVTEWEAGSALSYAEAAEEEALWHIIGAVYDDDDTVEDWKKDFPMTKESDGTYTITINVRGAFKFRCFKSTTVDADKWNTQLGFYQGTDPEFVLDLVAGYKLEANNGASADIKVAEDGNYTFVLDVANDYNLTGTKN